ncbi:hypothetical protein LX80_02520 [Hydrotalea sandarakina]|jgi:hypothetical protein|uniref:Uncharacterized protein n=1 Tax=Hydrotalea sandarakina TaxID=1004304 RepID=A0A2W7TBY3_9BACT|nr:hypothetical protein LX80_02520 [Hydrotalea sandarakina]
MQQWWAFEKICSTGVRLILCKPHIFSAFAETVSNLYRISLEGGREPSVCMEILASILQENTLNKITIPIRRNTFLQIIRIPYFSVPLKKD